MDSIFEPIEKNIYVIEQVLSIIIIILVLAVFGLGVTLIHNTVVTETDLLLGTVVSDSDRSKIKTITGLSLTVVVLQVVSAFLRYRFH